MNFLRKTQGFVKKDGTKGEWNYCGNLKKGTEIMKNEKRKKKDLIDREIRKKYSERSTDITILFCS